MKPLACLLAIVTALGGIAFAQGREFSPSLGAKSGAQTFVAVDVETTPRLTKSESDSKNEEDKEKTKPYPLDTCIVTDNKLGSMGDPVTIVHENQEIKLCCKACEKKFKKEPEKYLKKLEPKS